MTGAALTEVGRFTKREGIDLRVPARPEHLALVRLVAAGVASQEDFDLDAIADVRLAVDEAVSALMCNAVAAATVHCRFRHQPDGLHMALSSVTRRGGEPDEHGFGWHVLNSLMHSVTSTSEPGPSGQDRIVRIELTKLGGFRTA